MWEECIMPYITNKGYVYGGMKSYELVPPCGSMMVHRRMFEEFYKCCMLKWGDVHHKNGDKQDNRIQNFEGIMHGKHSSISKKRGDRSDRKCSRCDSEITRIQVQYRPKQRREYMAYIWHRVDNGFYCDHCAKTTGVAYNRETVN